MPERSERDPIRHTRKIRSRIDELIGHLRSDVEKIDAPQAEALFETAAETLEGLQQAFKDYEGKDEAAWREEEEPLAKKAE